MPRLVFAVVFATLAGPCLAQEVDRPKIAAALQKFWQDRRAEVLAAPALAAKDAPALDSTGLPLCPVHRVSMQEFVIEKETRQDAPDAPAIVVRQFVAAFCPPGPEAFLRVETADGPVWRGPFADPGFPIAKSRPIEIPVGPRPGENAVSREAVHKCLMRHITDSGEQGFFENRFQDVKDLGPGAIGRLFEIFDTTTDAQIKHLAIEALGEVADPGARDRLMAMSKEKANERYLLSIGVALHRIGETSVVDEIVGNLEANLERAGPPQRSAIHAQLGLILSLVRKEDKALEHYQRAVELDPTNSIAFYNLACSYSKLGRVDDALDTLEGAMKAGYDDWEWMMVDGDLEKARKDPRFQALFERYRK